MPHFDRPVPGAERLLYRLLPQAQDVQRNLFFALYEATRDRLPRAHAS